MVYVFDDLVELAVEMISTISWLKIFLLSLNLNGESWWCKVVFYVGCVNFGMNVCVFEEKAENIRHPIIENFFKIV